MKKLILSSMLLLAAAFTASAQTNTEIQIEHLRNATFKIYYGGDVILVDPMLGSTDTQVELQAGDLNYKYDILVDLPYAAKDAVEDVTAVLLTSARNDHFDATAIGLLDKHLPLLVQPNDEKAVEAEGFRNVVGVTSAVRIGKTKFIRVLGSLGSRLMDKRMGPSAGYLISRTGLPTIYVVGDVLPDNTVRTTIQKYNPDIIVTYSGGAKVMEMPVMMDATHTSDLARFANGPVVVAVNMGAVENCTVSREAMVRSATRQGLNIAVPEDGEFLAY